jgi:hypothetical protein
VNPPRRRGALSYRRAEFAAARSRHRLDRPSEDVVMRLSQTRLQNASFLTASAFEASAQSGKHFSMQGWLSDLAGRTKDLVDEIDTADLVVMVARTPQPPRSSARPAAPSA